jgi:hypothetical protein
MFKNLRLFGETWKSFPKGILPLALLKELAARLAQSAEGCYALPGEATPLVIVASAVTYAPHKLGRFGARELDHLLQTDMDHLARLLLPGQGEQSGGRWREAILSTIARLGQVYHLCLRRWKKASARSIFWGSLETMLNGVFGRALEW